MLLCNAEYQLFCYLTSQLNANLQYLSKKSTSAVSNESNELLYKKWSIKSLRENELF